MDEITRRDDDVFWQKVGAAFRIGAYAFAGWLAYGIATWALGVGTWNW